MIEGSLGSSLFCSPGYFRLQVLPDDPGNNTYGHTPLHIQTGDSKRYIVLFAGHPVVIAGVGYRIDAIGEAHIDNALVDICDTAGILALDTALLQVVPVGVLGNTLDVSFDAQVLQTAAPHGLPTADSYAAGLGVDTTHDEVNVSTEHVAKDLILAQHKVGVFLTGRTAAQIDHHFLDRDNDTEPLVIHNCHRLAVVQLFNAAQLAGDDLAGAVGVMDFMSDYIMTVFGSLDIIPAVDGKDGGLAALGAGLALGRRRSRGRSGSFFHDRNICFSRRIPE